MHTSLVSVDDIHYSFLSVSYLCPVNIVRVDIDSIASNGCIVLHGVLPPRHPVAGAQAPQPHPVTGTPTVILLVQGASRTALRIVLGF